MTMLDAVLDSWDRNNAILVGLLGEIPTSGLAARAMPGSPSVAQMLTHIHYVRMVFITEDVPEMSVELPGEWVDERDATRIAGMLNDSAKAVRDAVRHRVETGQPMNLHYDHPILFLQHMIWHEGYHQGQIKLALKASGQPMPDEVAGPVTWHVWMDKTAPAS
jgi:uncharacterized damage-inducible protein DinB